MLVRVEIFSAASLALTSLVTVTSATFSPTPFPVVDAWSPAAGLAALGVALRLVLLHDRPRRDFLGTPAIAAGLPGGCLDVLVLASLLRADAAQTPTFRHDPSFRVRKPVDQ